MNKQYNNISVFKNTKRTKDNQPLYNVAIEMADGTKWEGGLWLKTSKNGTEYLSGLLNPPYQGGQRSVPRPAPKAGGSFDDMDDDVPFDAKPAQSKAVDW